MRTRVSPLHGRKREGSKNRESQDSLAEDHRVLREQQLPATHGTVPRKQHIQDQAHHHRGEGQQTLHHDHQRATSGETPHCQHVAGGDARNQRQHQSEHSDLDGHPDNAPELRIAAKEQTQSLAQGVKEVHAYLALGKNICSPLTLKSAMAFCPSAEIIQLIRSTAPS